MRTTSVSTRVARRAQSTTPPLAASSWPVTTANEDGDAAVRDRDAREAGTATADAHAGHDLEGHPGRGQRLGLLAAPAEHERIAALEPHDPAAPPRVVRPAAR